MTPVYADEHYAVYEITDLLCSDEDTLAADLLAIFPEAEVTAEELTDARQWLRENIRECFGYPD